MRTDHTISEFLATCVAADLSKSTIEWNRDSLLHFVHSCPTLPRRPEPIEGYMAEDMGSPKVKSDVYRLLKT